MVIAEPVTVFNDLKGIKSEGQPVYKIDELHLIDTFWLRFLFNLVSVSIVNFVSINTSSGKL